MNCLGNYNIKSIIDSVGEYWIIGISGNKKKEKESENLENNFGNKRELGDLSITIPLKNEEFLIIIEPLNAIAKNGVFIIDFNLDKKKDLYHKRRRWRNLNNLLFNN